MSELAEDPAAADHAQATSPEPEQIRQGYRRDEALVRGVGRLQVIFGLLAAALSVFQIVGTLETYRIVTAPGAPITADWVFDPGRNGFMLVLAAYGLVGMVIGYGLRRLQRWAARAEMVVLLLALFGVLLAYILVVVGPEEARWLSMAVFMPMFALPGLAFAFLSTYPAVGTVLSVEYAEVVVRTAHVKVKPKIPWSIKLVLVGLMIPLLVAAVGVDGTLKRPR
jgi:hypothetical protein